MKTKATIIITFNVNAWCGADRSHNRARGGHIAWRGIVHHEHHDNENPFNGKSDAHCATHPKDKPPLTSEPVATVPSAELMSQSGKSAKIYLFIRF